MKKIAVFLSFLFLALTFAPGISAQSIYDRTGSFQGKINSDGRIYDRTGSFQGNVNSDGRIYDRTGSFQGNVNSDGRIYDRTGSYKGSVSGVSQKNIAAAMFFFFKP